MNRKEYPIKDRETTQQSRQASKSDKQAKAEEKRFAKSRAQEQKTKDMNP